MVSVNRSLPISTETEVDTRPWLEAIAQGKSKKELDTIWAACDFIQSKQSSTFGPQDIVYALAVADILAKFRMDYQTIIAAILYHIVISTKTKISEIREHFGEEIAHLVQGVKKSGIIWSITQKTKTSFNEPEKLRQMLLAMAEDIRVVLIVLAERLQYLRELTQQQGSQNKQETAKETIEIFAPLANRLGIWQLKWEMEDLAFRFTKPEAYISIAKLLSERRLDREDYMQNIVTEIERLLKKNQIGARVSGRPKHIYSIWKKMQRKKVDFDQIFDVRAVRILVETKDDCYKVLGIVHGLFKNIQKEFDDYIANPKENDYQSLHTAVIATQGKTVEIQIRTHEMHQHAELGVASHWSYKEGANHDETMQQKISWLRNLLEWKDEFTDASDFIDRFKSEIFQDRVYVFTPVGKVIDLPYGATPIDFAYYVHTDIGHSCGGAIIDGRIAPLTTCIKTGNQIEILRSTKRNGPSRDWLFSHLGYVTTPRAKAKIRAWFNQIDYSQSIKIGRETFRTQIKKLGVKNITSEEIAKQFNFNQVDDFYVAISRNDIAIDQLNHVVQKNTILPTKKAQKYPLRTKQNRTSRNNKIEVLGSGNILSHLAKCCQPLPEDKITGFITHGYGISVHRKDCPKLIEQSKNHPERIVEVEWNPINIDFFQAEITIRSEDRRGLLNDITALLSKEKINLTQCNSFVNSNAIAIIVMSIEVIGLAQLSKLLDKIGQIQGIIETHRSGQE